MEITKINNHMSLGLLWVMGWLFTLGYLHLSFGTGLLAIFVWPYYIGSALGI